MTECEDWHRKIVKILDNEAGDEDQRQVAKHLRFCSSCREFRDKFAKIRYEASSITEPELPAGIKDELNKEIQVDVQSQPFCSLLPKRTYRDSGGLRHPRWRWYLSTAALFLIATLSTVCAVLARKNITLELNLRLAQQEIELLHGQQQNAGTQDNQQLAISELHVRVTQLEKQVHRGISPGMAWYSESPYYSEEWPDKL